MYSPKDIWSSNGHLLQTPSVVYVAVFLVAGILGYILKGRRKQAEGKQPPWLVERIPYITNTYQYWTDMESFLDRAG